MGIDLFSGLTPSATFVGKVTDEFLVLGIDTDDRIASFQIMVSEPDGCSETGGLGLDGLARSSFCGWRPVHNLAVSGFGDRCTANVVCLLTQKTTSA